MRELRAPELRETFLEGVDATFCDGGRVASGEHDVLGLLYLEGPPADAFNAFSVEPGLADWTPEDFTAVHELGGASAVTATENGGHRVAVVGLAHQVVTVGFSELRQEGLLPEGLDGPKGSLLGLLGLW